MRILYAEPVLSVSQWNLCEIVFGRQKPGPLKNSIPEGEPLHMNTLKDMCDMVKIEFASSLLKEIDTPTDVSFAGPATPNAYDVYRVEPNLSSGNADLAVCVPVRKMKMLVWLDKEKMLWELDDLRPLRCVASVAGPSRVLDSLQSVPPTLLMRTAMRRESLYRVDEQTSQLVTTLPNEMASNMNESQKQAIASIRDERFSFGFFICQGPPGTGKTTTLVGMIYASVQEKEKVLVCAPSNAAVANIALKLEQAKLFTSGRLLVFGNNCDASVHHLNPVKRSERFQTFLKMYQDDEDGDKKANALQNFASWLKMETKQPTIEEIFDACPCIVDGHQGRKVLAGLLLSARVILCTLNSAGSAFLLSKAGNRTTLFLDEAGQCPEG